MYGQHHRYYTSARGCPKCGETWEVEMIEENGACFVAGDDDEMNCPECGTPSVPEHELDGLTDDEDATSDDCLTQTEYDAMMAKRANAAYDAAFGGYIDAWKGAKAHGA